MEKNVEKMWKVSLKRAKALLAFLFGAAKNNFCSLPPGGEDVGCDHISVHMSAGTQRHVIAHQR